MDNPTLQLLNNLTAGADLQLYGDAMAIQIGKYGALAVAFLAGIAALYFLLNTLGVLGGMKRSAISIVICVIAAVTAFLMYQQSQSFAALDVQKPILSLSAKTLDYDIATNGWSVAWPNITAIELKTEVFQKKQSVAQTHYEIRAHVKSGAAIKWKYDAAPDNDIATAQKLQETSGYLVINPEALAVGADVLQMALEKYRAGL
jgi:hypothetical protein